MTGRYLVIDKKVLPEVYEKVLEVKKILKEGKIKEITEATKKIGISRSVYYKYKDYIFDFSESAQGRKMTFSMMIKHRKGVLSNILNYLSDIGGNILTIDQGLPINEIANLTITIDMSMLELDLTSFLDCIGKIENVEKVDFIAME
ncbi:MAG: ACT domain-containing protein [Clostridium sp.]|uniref:ACT domain-containing protein n=1 Tax=Clostridium TaxID=1485 RepID=UPI0018836C16|nr:MULTISPECIES: ACT domain-containing protein [Clostridium]MCR6515678.1 ACT domain-containing protein [Clostridium sp. LY3-2]